MLKENIATRQDLNYRELSQTRRFCRDHDRHKGLIMQRIGLHDSATWGKLDDIR